MLRRLRASYQSSQKDLQREPLYIPMTSFISQREIRRLPQFVCYNDIVTTGEDRKRTCVFLFLFLKILFVFWTVIYTSSQSYIYINFLHGILSFYLLFLEILFWKYRLNLL